MNQYSLLIADDEETARRRLVEGIAWERLGIGPCLEARDGLEALELAERERPDILILDLKMPGADGLEVLERLVEAHSEVKVIALSGYSEFEAARKMLSSGLVVDYLLKPATEDMLFESVFKCIERIEEKRQLRSYREREESAGQPQPPLSVSPSKAAAVQEVKDYIRAHYQEHLTLDQMARLVYLNPTYLSRLFSQAEGMGFSDYLTAVRMERARELLKDYRLRIYQVAEAVGYQNVRHFMKVFRRQTGQTPGEYREQALYR